MTMFQWHMGTTSALALSEENIAMANYWGLFHSLIGLAKRIHACMQYILFRALNLVIHREHLAPPVSAYF